MHVGEQDLWMIGTAVIGGAAVGTVGWAAMSAARRQYGVRGMAIVFCLLTVCALVAGWARVEFAPHELYDLRPMFAFLGGELVAGAIWIGAAARLSARAVLDDKSNER